MKRLLGIILLSTSVHAGYAKSVDQIDITDLATCTAAAMKSGQGIILFNKWSNALQAKYQLIYPQKSHQEIDSYSAGRIMDKKRRLQEKGLDSTSAFKNYYDVNCKSYESRLKN